jgi:hypothetical protein
VDINFTRHAKRRAKLYGISLETITGIVADMNLREGSNTITKKVSGLQFPLKIVLVVKDAAATIITAYPLKRGIKK